jgi:CubicO group peptidase (beta-lactamase class C family)
VATVQAVLACGGEVGGVRLLTADGCEAVFREQWNGPIGILGVPMRLGMGYGLISPDVPLSPNPRSCFWGGWGGSLVVVDLDARLCFAYMMNKMGGGLTGDFRAFELVMTLYDALADKT